jgi:hypothetical protein
MNHNYINNGKKQVAQTKEEQEALINKLSTYAKRVDEVDSTIDAGYMDFSKSVDDQGVRDAVAEDDPRRMVSKFPVPCYTCDKMGNV